MYFQPLLPAVPFSSGISELQDWFSDSFASTQNVKLALAWPLDQIGSIFLGFHVA